MTLSAEIYYDRITGDVFGDASGCTLEQWRPDSHARFAVHPHGFPIFDPAHALASDEYESGDPYQAESASSFQSNRQELTLELLSDLRRRRPLERIVDVGCGVGQITRLFAQAFPEAAVYGIDRSVQAIARATEAPSSIHFAAADAYDLPFAPESMDAVICNNIWEHVPDPLRLLGELSRVLRRGGGLIVSTPSRYRIENLARVLQGKPVEHMSRHHVTEYSVGQMIELFRFGGFEVVGRRSRMVLPGRLTPKDRVLYWLVAPALRTAVRLTESHHDLASTVFFLALKGA